MNIAFVGDNRSVPRRRRKKQEVQKCAVGPQEIKVKLLEDVLKLAKVSDRRLSPIVVQEGGKTNEGPNVPPS